VGVSEICDGRSVGLAALLRLIKLLSQGVTLGFDGGAPLALA